MASVMQLLPKLDGEEMVYVQGLLKDWEENPARQFAAMYRARRKDPQLILLTTLLGFMGITGVQRFILGHIGMSLLYLFTAGLCFLGTIVDLVNFKSLSFTHNPQIARQLDALIKASH
ncbi:MAG: NINE protein [candidate division KSB1 bacterium]|nr:NINE protein [candidate division KSB1 bacterium]MDZ7275044.1 NINE protein [candidate division KSB1 bacterium]MDZ7286508.1 NINE protein [candidate division KSB1 bacterium]MDZ7299328.1 NINE protein [candidate division KSB1 bacterium]MDZ7307000.1 NINE protein [candidate division KSB1 bacterium]